MLALLSIFGPEGFVRKESSPAGEIRVSVELPEDFTVTLTQDETVLQYELSHLPPLLLTFELPEDYPESSPPSFTLTCSWMTPSQLSALGSQLADLYLASGGAVVLFSWVQFLRADALGFLGIGARFQLPADEGGSRHFGPNSENNDSSKSASSSLPPPDPSGASCGARGSSPFPSLTPSQTLLSQLLIYNADEKQRAFSSSLFDCGVCLVSRPGSECVTLPGCHHVFCRPCLTEFCKVQISEGNIRGVSCPEASCKAGPAPAQLKSLVGEELFSRYDRLLLQSTLDLMSDVTYCPRPRCASPVIVEKSGGAALCSVCAFAFCVACRKTYHGAEDCRTAGKQLAEAAVQEGTAELPQSEVGLKALLDDYNTGTKARRRLLLDRYGRTTMRQVLPNILSESWMSDNCKHCPRCLSKIEKNRGCNMMTCSRCGQLFCWMCLSRLLRLEAGAHFEGGDCRLHEYTC